MIVNLKSLNHLKDYLPIKGSDFMTVREIRCPRCKRLLFSNLGADISVDRSTNRLQLVPTESDIVLETRCARCKKYAVIFKLGVVNGEHGNE